MRRKKVREQHNPPAIQRDRGATPDPESLPNFATSYFLRIFNALKIHLLGKKTFALQLPLEQAVTHSVPSSAIFRLRFAVCILTSVSFVGELAAQETFSCLGGSSTRWMPPRFDTREGGPCLYHSVHRTHLILSGYIVQYTLENVKSIL